MEAITIGIALGAGAVLALKHGRASSKKALGWAARQAGWVTGQVNAAIGSAKSLLREQYERGREENLAKPADVPPLSSRNGTPVPPSPPSGSSTPTATAGKNGKTAHPS